MSLAIEDVWSARMALALLTKSSLKCLRFGTCRRPERVVRGVEGGAGDSSVFGASSNTISSSGCSSIGFNSSACFRRGVVSTAGGGALRGDGVRG